MRGVALGKVKNLRNLVWNVKLSLDAFFSRCWKHAEGQDLVEYALLAGFFAVAAAGVLDPIGDSVEKIFRQVRSLLVVARKA